MYCKKYEFGDVVVSYVETPVEGHEKKTVIGFTAYPKEFDVDPKKLHCDSLVQVAFTGDEPLIDYTPGVSMRNRNSTLLKIERQTEFSQGNLNTYLTDGAGNQYIHRLWYDRETGVFTVEITYENRTGAPQTLEYFPSLSLSGLASPVKHTTCGFRLHRMTSAWSRECRLVTDTFSRLGMDMSWARYGVKSEKWGQNGSMPNRGYFPFGAIEDAENGVVWGVMPEAPYSWEMELYEEKESCSITAGLAGYESGHWRKVVPAGGRFTAHRARFTVKRRLQDVFNAFVHEQDARLSVPASEQDMPVMYNEYCATWGNPSEAKIDKQLAAVAPLGVKYFIIDSGWYKPLDRNWCNAIGDWDINPTIFPDMKRVVDKIKAHGMKAGIWYEFEITGRDSNAFRFEEAHVRRDGKTLTCKNRRFLDLRLPQVKSYLEEKLVRTLRENGFEYLKIDYNENIGIGCDAPDGSLGEGGRQLTEESLWWLEHLKEKIPGIVIENCSSGGSRIEPLRMNKVSMCSFSDAHECAEIPLVAANVSRVVPARQSQIWAVIRKNETPSRTIYSLCAAMMGRICLSGDISPRNKERMTLLKEGLAFYESVKDIVRRGDIVQIDCNVEYYREPQGRQIYVKDYKNRRLVIVHFLDCETGVEIPLDGYSLKAAFTDLPYTADGALSVEGGSYRAGAFLLEK